LPQGSRPIRRVAVIGAGTMGHGIAQVAAMAGYETRLTDTSSDALDGAMSRIASNLSGAVSRSKMTQKDADAAIARIATAADLMASVRDADLVIEAVAEDLATKEQLFRQLDAVVGDAAILTTNTSSLSITRLASATRRPERGRPRLPRGQRSATRAAAALLRLKSLQERPSRPSPQRFACLTVGATDRAPHPEPISSLKLVSSLKLAPA